MVSRSHSNNFLLSALLVFIVVIVLITSSFFYFSMLTENNVLNAHVVYSEGNFSNVTQNSNSDIIEEIDYNISSTSISK